MEITPIIRVPNEAAQSCKEAIDPVINPAFLGYKLIALAEEKGIINPFPTEIINTGIMILAILGQCDAANISMHSIPIILQINPIKIIWMETYLGYPD